MLNGYLTTLPASGGQRQKMDDLYKLYLSTIGIQYLPGYQTEQVPVPPGDEVEQFKILEDLREFIGDCHRCQLGDTRSTLVFGTGNPEADILFVGEAPGRDEDIQGEPFVGKAGQLLTKIIIAMGLARDEVYICNVIKCRPPRNRNPLPVEVTTCKPFLESQIEIISPRVICALGSFAAQTLLETDIRISMLRGHFHDLNGIPLMPTYHPSYLLRNPSRKADVWEDIQKIMKHLGLGMGDSKN